MSVINKKYDEMIVYKIHTALDQHKKIDDELL